MHVLIIGAGASGLMAAYELRQNGIEVTILEAQSRVGGRIHTFKPDGFSFPVEAAAEFVHGPLPLTLGLLEKAGIVARPATGAYYYQSGKGLSEGFGETHGWPAFYNAMFSIDEDITIEALLQSKFGDEKYAALRKDVHDMAQGLDLADPSQLSVFCVREEWTSDEPQFRPDGGYGPLIDWLLRQCEGEGFRLLKNTRVTGIEWEEGSVKVYAGSAVYTADKVLVTVPLPALQHDLVTIVPDVGISAKAKQIGWGEVIKIAMEFESPFWEKDYPDLGFLFTEEGFTFWTQLSEKRPLLTGWVGNDYASAYDEISDDSLIQKAIAKLEDVFPSINIKKALRASAVFRYTSFAPSGGGYSWLKPESYDVLSVVREGFGNTLYFAGEAWHREHTATVEGALQSGRDVALKILA